MNKNLQKSSGRLRDALLFPSSLPSGLAPQWSLSNSRSILRRGHTYLPSSIKLTCREKTLFFMDILKNIITISSWTCCSGCRLPEVRVKVSWQNVYKENGQADVEQDDHAYHDGVRTLDRKHTKQFKQTKWYLCNHFSLLSALLCDDVLSVNMSLYLNDFSLALRSASCNYHRLPQEAPLK